MAKKGLTRKGKIIAGIGICVVVLLLAAGTVLIWYQNYLKEITPVPNNGLQVEAGTSVPTPEKYFSHLGNFEAEKTVIKYIDTESRTTFLLDENGDESLPVGKYDVLIHCEGWPEAFVSSLTVTDTTPPVLSLNHVSVEYGDQFSEDDFLKNCTDNSGESCTLSFVVTDADGNTVEMPSSTDSGTYLVTVTATDAKGNSSNASTELVIGQKPVPKQDPSPSQSDPKTTYSISINRAQNTVTIYKLDENHEYQPFKAMVCSTGGSNTPLGNFNLGARYPWLLLYGGVYGQYTIRIYGSIAFHSVPYFTQDKSDLEYDEYNKLGSTASAGCVRLSVEDVKWIYDNCEAGTPVTIYDGEDPGPLGKPASITIDPSSPNRGWDPTDPDPNNPWKQS